MRSILNFFILVFFVQFSTSAQNTAPKLDPDSKKAKSLNTLKFEKLKIESEEVFIKGGVFNGERIKGFYLDKTLVTVEQYEACVKAGVCPPLPDNGN